MRIGRRRRWRGSRCPFDLARLASLGVCDVYIIDREVSSKGKEVKKGVQLVLMDGTIDRLHQSMDRFIYFASCIRPIPSTAASRLPSQLLCIDQHHRSDPFELPHNSHATTCMGRRILKIKRVRAPQMDVPPRLQSPCPWPAFGTPRAFHARGRAIGALTPFLDPRRRLGPRRFVRCYVQTQSRRGRVAETMPTRGGEPAPKQTGMAM